MSNPNGEAENGKWQVPQEVAEAVSAILGSCGVLQRRERLRVQAAAGVPEPQELVDLQRLADIRSMRALAHFAQYAHATRFHPTEPGASFRNREYSHGHCGVVYAQDGDEIFVAGERIEDGAEGVSVLKVMVPQEEGQAPWLALRAKGDSTFRHVPLPGPDDPVELYPTWDDMGPVARRDIRDSVVAYRDRMAETEGRR